MVKFSLINNLFSKITKINHKINECINVILDFCAKIFHLKTHKLQTISSKFLRQNSFSRASNKRVICHIHLFASKSKVVI